MYRDHVFIQHSRRNWDFSLMHSQARRIQLGCYHCRLSLTDTYVCSSVYLTVVTLFVLAKSHQNAAIHNENNITFGACQCIGCMLTAASTLLCPHYSCLLSESNPYITTNPWTPYLRMTSGEVFIHFHLFCGCAHE